MQYPALHIMADTLRANADANAFVQAHEIAQQLDARGYLILTAAFYRKRMRRGLLLGFGAGAACALSLFCCFSW